MEPQPLKHRKPPSLRPFRHFHRNMYPQLQAHLDYFQSALVDSCGIGSLSLQVLDLGRSALVDTLQRREGSTRGSYPHMPRLQSSNLFQRGVDRSCPHHKEHLHALSLRPVLRWKVEVRRLSGSHITSRRSMRCCPTKLSNMLGTTSWNLCSRTFEA